MISAVDPVPVRLRPLRIWRTCAWALAVFGTIFGIVGAAHLATDASAGGLVLAFGVIITVGGVAGATSYVRGGPYGIVCRSLLTRRVPTDEIAGIECRVRQRYGYKRVGIVVIRKGRRSLWLHPLDLPDRPANHRRVQALMSRLQQAVGQPAA